MSWVVVVLGVVVVEVGVVVIVDGVEVGVVVEVVVSPAGMEVDEMPGKY